MRYAIRPVPCSRFLQAPVKRLSSLALSLLLAACGSNHTDSAIAPSAASTPAPAPAPVPTAANTVVAYPSETAELKLYAGQSRQITLSFKTSDGGSATALALDMPAGGLPAGWSIAGSRMRCEQVDVDNLCQIALAYAPTAAEQPSVVSFPYSYRNNRGEAGAGSIAIAYRALPVNAATTALLPAGPVKGVVGKTVTVLLSFGTNDDSPATDLHLDTGLAALPAGWTSPAAGLDCANFGAGSTCRLALIYAPASAAPASALGIGYRYRDSSGKQQTATATIDYSAVAANTVGVSLDPAGVVRARAGASQQVKLAFSPSDINPASKLRLLTDTGKLPAGWTVKDSTLPCEKVDGSGGCGMTLVYAPGPDQPAGTLAIDYAYTDAAGRELAGATALSYASHDYRVYVTDYGDIAGGATVGGGVRQCEQNSDGTLRACVKVDTAWPIFGVSEIGVYGSRAYVGAVTGTINGVNVPDRQVAVCNIAADNALVDCAGAGRYFNQLVALAVGRLGAFVISAGDDQVDFSLFYCKPAQDGYPDMQACGVVGREAFPETFPYAVTSTDANVYVAATDPSRAKKQAIFSCVVADSRLDCKYFDWGIEEKQLIERMSFGQAGGRSYLYLATSALLAPDQGGRIVKCQLVDGVANKCGQGTVPKGLQDADLIRIRDLRIVGNSAWLVTGKDSLSAAVYRCAIDQQTGDLDFCASAGNVEGAVRNFGIAVR
jgi:hypothetical protein